METHENMEIRVFHGWLLSLSSLYENIQILFPRRRAIVHDTKTQGEDEDFVQRPSVAIARGLTDR